MIHTVASKHGISSVTGMGMSSYEIGIGLSLAAGARLEPLALHEVDRLGAEFAAISPWSQYPISGPALAAYFARREEGAPRLALLNGAEIVGVLGLRLEWLRGPYVQFLGILPRHQGQGFGGAVLRWLEGTAGASGEGNLWVCASGFNARALTFYEEHGFQRVASLDGLVRDNFTEILLRKRLAVVPEGLDADA